MRYGKIYAFGTNPIEAERLLGTKVIFSDDLGEICFSPWKAHVGVLTDCNLFGFQKDKEEYFSYIRELPKYDIGAYLYDSTHAYWFDQHHNHHVRVLEAV